MSNSMMKNVCAVFDTNHVSCFGNHYVHELGVIGIGKWSESYSCIYDIKNCVVMDYKNTGCTYGLSLDTEGSGWKDIYEDINTHWKYYKSGDRCVVAIVDNEPLKKILNASLIPSIDLSEEFGTPRYYNNKRTGDGYKKYACGQHTISLDGCTGARVTAYRDWVHKNL